MRESLTYETGLREECGVFGMFDLEGGDVARDMYYGLSALQHRGQESCGIAVCDTNGPKGVVNCYKASAAIWELVMSATPQLVLLPSKTHSHWYLSILREHSVWRTTETW